MSATTTFDELVLRSLDDAWGGILKRIEVGDGVGLWLCPVR